MNEIPNISQTTAMGSNNSQVGLQYNHEEHHHYGLTVADATSMAFAMFREYYPQLRQEALDSLDQMVTEKLQRVPPECIVPPTARITIPALQNASITGEQDVRELYANLLVNSMNTVVKNGIHPGFVEIIKQLSPDEAKILRYMSTHNRIATVNLVIVYDPGGRVPYLKDFTDILQTVGCEYPLESEKYVDNLVRLGLLRRSVNEWLVDKSRYESTKNNPYLVQLKARVEKAIEGQQNYKMVDIEERYVDLTSFGKSFCSVCLGVTKTVKATVQSK